MGSSESRPEIPKMNSAIVLHRGYHGKEHNLMGRPVENTLEAFKQGWELGYVQCECDVTVTKDGDLVLCHDPVWIGLASMVKMGDTAYLNLGKKRVYELTSKETFKGIILLDGQHPARLLDVLECAKKLSSDGFTRQLIIEIKWNEEWGKCVSGVIDLLFRDGRCDLLEHVSVIMSFSTDIMLEVSKQMEMFRRKVDTLPRLMYLVTESELDVKDNELVYNVAERIMRTKVDGVYMQYQEGMVKYNGVTRKNFRNLIEKFAVGVWGCPDDPDIVDQLVDMGVDYVNTDLN